jgi:hypothetical protein
LEICATSEKGTLPSPATFKVNPEVPVEVVEVPVELPEPMVTLSTVPLMYVLIAVPWAAPSTTALTE